MFLPNIFAGVYQELPGFVESIPEKALEVDDKFGFSLNAGSFMFVILVYALLWLVFFLASSKYNTNRSLRDVLLKIYNTRIKWGLIWDVVWLFELNVLVYGFLQFKYTNNTGETALAVISLLVFIALPACGLVYRIKKFNSEDTEDVDNFRSIHEGYKPEKYQYLSFVYWIRKIVFAAIIAGSIGGPTKTQATLLILIAVIMALTLIIIRPFKEKIRNVMHILNEVGLAAIAAGFIVYRNYLDQAEPVGTRIDCGSILTIGIIIHLSLAICWALYRSYYYFKETYSDFQSTEFYSLYLDEKYDENLEKELQELNDETGTVEGIELTNGSQISESLAEPEE